MLSCILPLVAGASDRGLEPNDRNGIPREGVCPIGTGIGDDETPGHCVERVIHGVDIVRHPRHDLTGRHFLDIGAGQLNGHGLIHVEDIDNLENDVPGSILFARTCE